MKMQLSLLSAVIVFGSVGCGQQSNDQNSADVPKQSLDLTTSSPGTDSGTGPETDTYSASLDAKYAAKANDLETAVKKAFGADRVGDKDFGYNAKLEIIGIQYTAQRAGEPIPTKRQLEANLSTFFSLVGRSGLPWKVLNFTAYGYNVADSDADKELLSGFWRHETLSNLNLTNTDGAILLENAFELPRIDPSVSD